MLTHIAVDTETLIAAGWPRPSADLENLIASCAAAGIPVLVSSVSVIEAETVWLERTGAAVAKVRSSLADLRRGLGALVPDVVLPGNDRLAGAYQEVAAALIERWQWEVVDPPAMTTKEIVELSARHRPPFRGKDTGFRDSYIGMSIVTGAGARSEIGLVSADNGLGDSAPLAAYAEANSVTIRRFRTPRDASEAIESEVHTAAVEGVRAEIQQRSDRVAAAVRADRERLAAFVRGRLEVPPDSWKQEGTLQAVRSVQVLDVTQVIAGLPDLDVTASVTVSLALEVEFRTYTVDGPIGLREGQREADMRTAISTGQRVTTTTVAGEATLDVRVTWPDDNGAPQVDYIDIEYGNAREAMDRKWMRHLLPRG